eukprot:scaffold13016_cov95-Skeletonema_marinoi.AAC.3
MRVVVRSAALMGINLTSPTAAMHSQFCMHVRSSITSTPNPPSPPSPPASPRPSWAPVPAGSWSHGCPDGPWGGMSHDGGDAYDFSKTPASWACRPVNNPPQQILQSNLDKYKNGGEFQSIMIGGTMTTVHKTFGHSLDTAKQDAESVGLSNPLRRKGSGEYGTFGTCNLKDPENPPVILLMSVSEQKKDALHKTEISNSAFTDGLDAPHHCAKHQFSCTRGEGFAIVEAMCICDCTQSCEEVKDDLYDDYQGVHQGRKRYSRCVNSSMVCTATRFYLRLMRWEEGIARGNVRIGSDADDIAIVEDVVK